MASWGISHPLGGDFANSCKPPIHSKAHKVSSAQSNVVFVCDESRWFIRDFPGLTLDARVAIGIFPSQVPQIEGLARSSHFFTVVRFEIDLKIPQ